MRPLWLIVAGVGVGVVVVLAAAVVFVGVDMPGGSSTARDVELSFPAVDHDTAAADDLVSAWFRWRTSSFVAEGTWSRSLDGSDSPLSGEIFTAQDPPRRVVMRLGAVIEEIDGARVTCEGSSGDLIVPGCVESGGASTYDELVAAEMSLVTRYVGGDTRIYDVDSSDGCFRVELLTAALRAPWGRAAEFCFDTATGALVSSRVRRQNATDVERNTIVRAVTEEDFSVRVGGG